MDQVRIWVDECTKIDLLDEFMPHTALYRAYKAWALRDGYRPVRAGEFYDLLVTMPGCLPTRRRNGGRGLTVSRETDTAGEFIGS